MHRGGGEERGLLTITKDPFDDQADHTTAGDGTADDCEWGTRDDCTRWVSPPPGLMT